MRNPSGAYLEELEKRGVRYDPAEWSLRFDNMLAVCAGGEDNAARASRTCDKARDDDVPLTVQQGKNYPEYVGIMLWRLDRLIKHYS